MKVTIIAVGRIKEKYFKDAIAEYSKRLQRFCEFNIFEVEDEKAPERLSPAELNLVKQKEAKRIERVMPKGAFVFALEVKGQRLSSEGFAEKIAKCMETGSAHIVFLIGGSNGLDVELSKSANAAISFSDMTLPHQLMRVVLSEQVYRAFKILNHETYHK